MRDASPRDRTKRLGRFSYPPVHPARIDPTSTRDDGRSPGLCVITAHRLPGTLRWHFDTGSSLTVAGAATASHRVPVSPFKGTIIRRRIIRDEAGHVNIAQRVVMRVNLPYIRRWCTLAGRRFLGTQKPASIMIRRTVSVASAHAASRPPASGRNPHSCRESARACVTPDRAAVGCWPVGLDVGSADPLHLEPDSVATSATLDGRSHQAGQQQSSLEVPIRERLEVLRSVEHSDIWTWL